MNGSDHGFFGDLLFHRRAGSSSEVWETAVVVDFSRWSSVKEEAHRQGIPGIMVFGQRGLRCLV